MPETINWHLASITVRNKADEEVTSEYYLSENEYSSLDEMRTLRSNGLITEDRYVFVFGATPLTPNVCGTRKIHLPSIASITVEPVASFEPAPGYDKLRRKTARDRALVL